MADFIPASTQEIVTTEAPQSRLSGGEVAQPYAELSSALDKVGDSLEKATVPLAEREGTQAVTTDNEGNLSVARMPVFGEAGTAYNRAVKFSALAQADATAKREDLAISKQFANDPDAYLAASTKFRQGIVQKVTQAAGPEVGISLDRYIDNGTTLNYRRLQNEKEATIRRNFDQDTRAAIESKSEDLVSLIKNGGAGSPQAVQLATDIHALVDERSSNPILMASKGQGDLVLKKLHQDMQGAAAEYKINTILKNPEQPYKDAIAASSERWGIDPGVLARQLYQESGFRTNAVSPAGAAGIAQFMPATAQRYGVDVRNPQSSIEGAAHYMSDLSKQFGGNTGLALAGYNWGEKNVAQWMAAGANPDAMPRETRNYVRAITGQDIAAWVRGERPNPLAMTGTAAPQGGVGQALAAVQAMRDDQSVDPVQRQINYERGLAAIKDYRENVVRQTNLAELGQKSQDHDFENKIILDRASDNPQITENDIKTAPGVSPDSKMRMLNWIKREDMPEPIAKVSQGNAMDLFRRMSLPEDDPARIGDLRPIRDAYIAGHLTRTDEEWLEKRFADARSPEGDRLSQIRSQFSKAVEPAIDKSNPLAGVMDPDGKLESYRFQRDIDQKVAQYQKEGKNPFDLFDPGKPDYLGKPEVLQQYQKTMQQSVKDLTRRITGVGTPAAAATVIPRRQPGETLDEFDKRTGIR